MITYAHATTETSTDLFTPNAQLELDRINYLTVVELSSFYDDVSQYNPDAPCLDEPFDPELIDVIWRTIRLESALGLIDIWS